MIAYAFPAELMEVVKSRWQSTTSSHAKLPTDSILLRLLETCYHASFRTSEQRPVQCVLACTTASDIPEGALRLSNHAVYLTDTEIVRLAPVTQRHQTVIGCEEIDGWLRVWGFFEYGHTWVQHTSGDPPAVPIQLSDFPPDCLTITIVAPGALSVSCGRIRLARLREGRVFVSPESPLQSSQNALGRFFQRLVDDLQLSIGQPVLANASAESSERRSLLNVYTTSILAILERIRSRRHGGSIVIAHLPMDERSAHVTYQVCEHTGIAGEILAYKDLDDALRVSPDNPDLSAELERCRTELAIRSMSRRLIRGISQISMLSAVDGAVLLDGSLRIMGFGVRFPLLLPSDGKVTDALSGNVHFCDQWGLRHQSVFSICQENEQSIGLVVSQDGEVKAIKSVDGRLFFWNGILD